MGRWYLFTFIFTFTFLLLLLYFSLGYAKDASSLQESEDLVKAKHFIQKVLKSNSRFVSTHKASYFEPFLDAQHPKATVVMCSDSRVHTHAISDAPDNEIFVIRNIGNQMSTAEGSVEYGVRHLHTPVLMFLGHSGCGAIKAASSDYSKESEAIKKELDTIKIPKGVENIEGVKINVNNQVAEALKKFDQEVKEGKLVIIGAIYDFRNELKKGHGKLNIININGETDPVKIKENPLIKGLY
ncbi:MAG: carbonic anhydrase [Thermodesulforhabdaceae bacterium]